MAIYSSVPPPSQAPAPAATYTPQPQSTSNSTPAQAARIDIESWTVSALQSLSVSPSARGTGVTLSIPLDAATKRGDDIVERDPRAKVKVHTAYKRKEPIMRDSLRRREVLLKGKEGSRRRQRWENDHLLHVPNAQPPLPSDWAPSATHPIHNVPYYLAPLWESGIRHRAEELAAQKHASTLSRNGFSETSPSKGRIPQDLRQKLKRSKGAKTLLQDLEQEIRKFVKEYEVRESKLREREGEEIDEEDEEIVFIGRDSSGRGITMSDEVKDVVEEQLEREKMVYEGLDGTPEGSFARWLVHCVAGYYGLTSRSVTVGRKREAYVGIREMRSGREGDEQRGELPRPLWGLI